MRGQLRGLDWGAVAQQAADLDRASVAADAEDAIIPPPARVATAPRQPAAGAPGVPFDGSLTGDAAAQASAINHAMEKLIASCPAQYFWSYNRYKKPHGVAAPEEAQAGA